MPSEDTQILLSDMEQALSDEGFVQAIKNDQVIIWDCHIAPGAEVVLDPSQDWLLWRDVKAQFGRARLSHERD